MPVTLGSGWQQERLQGPRDHLARTPLSQQGSLGIAPASPTRQSHQGGSRCIPPGAVGAAATSRGKHQDVTGRLSSRGPFLLAKLVPRAGWVTLPPALLLWPYWANFPEHGRHPSPGSARRPVPNTSGSFGIQGLQEELSCVHM